MGTQLTVWQASPGTNFRIQQGGELLATIAFRARPDHGREIRTPSARWAIGWEKVRKRRALVARTESGECVGCAYDGWLPHAYRVWIAPDSWYRLRGSVLKSAWRVRDDDGGHDLMRLSGSPHGGFSNRRNPARYPGDIDLSDEARGIAECLLLVVIALEVAWHELPTSGS
jgi:hypothetical protein